ncbi:hypothetical protein [Kaistella pullorum]|uniref:DUF4468 domain-containing protein n=1 Tax=Kaistella pullorum TaxID=2763074 RepID=A0ABR8WQ83_9FLAO|nr:hypothetical protein [Kaistella pullorum]MBD8019155.1 hypothetical protein [Kaistella pullorum]
MRKILFLFVTNLYFAQTNETLKDFKIDEIKMGETVASTNAEQKIGLAENIFFKELTYKTNKDIKVNQIQLRFTKDKVLNKNKYEILDILKKNFGDYYYTFDNYYFYRKNLQKALAVIDYVGGVKDSQIVFHKYEPEVSEKIDEFTDTKYISVQTSGWDDVYINMNNYYRIGFKGVESKELRGIFMTISTKNDDWKFIENLIFLNDGETFELAAKSDREVTKDGKTKEFSVVLLTKEQIDIILKSNVSKLRISGKSNDDVVLTTFVKESLRVLNEYMNK